MAKKFPKPATSSTGVSGDAVLNVGTSDDRSVETTSGSEASPDPLADDSGDAGQQQPTAAVLVRTLDPQGNCGNCGNPHIARYGEGKWKCVCGAGNL